MGFFFKYANTYILLLCTSLEQLVGLVHMGKKGQLAGCIMGLPGKFWACGHISHIGMVSFIQGFNIHTSLLTISQCSPDISFNLFSKKKKMLCCFTPKRRCVDGVEGRGKVGLKCCLAPPSQILTFKYLFVPAPLLIFILHVICSLSPKPLLWSDGKMGCHLPEQPFLSKPCSTHWFRHFHLLSFHKTSSKYLQ